MKAILLQFTCHIKCYLSVSNIYGQWICFSWFIWSKYGAMATGSLDLKLYLQLPVQTHLIHQLLLVTHLHRSILHLLFMFMAKVYVWGCSCHTDEFTTILTVNLLHILSLQIRWHYLMKNAPYQSFICKCESYSE